MEATSSEDKAKEDDTSTLPLNRANCTWTSGSWHGANGHFSTSWTKLAIKHPSPLPIEVSW